VACRVLKVSTSGYYEWLGRPESLRETRNRELMKLIRAIHEESRGTYGWPRVHAELVLGLGEMVNRKRVARIMGQAGLQGIHRRKGRKNLASAATEEDLVHRGCSKDRVTFADEFPGDGRDPDRFLSSGSADHHRRAEPGRGRVDRYVIEDVAVERPQTGIGWCGHDHRGTAAPGQAIGDGTYRPLVSAGPGLEDQQPALSQMDQLFEPA
jgi:putative transposase